MRRAKEVIPLYELRYGDMVRTFLDGADERTRLVITTNGFVKRNGEAVMGRGCARQIRDAYPGFAKKLGVHIQANGNTVGWFPEEKVFTLPVKRHWYEKADLLIIAHSMIQLVHMLGEGISGHTAELWMPKPGCGNGKLDWTQVEPFVDAFSKAVKPHVVVWDWR